MSTPLHPLLVHFPIALLCTAALWDLLRRQPEQLDFGWRLWCLGTAAAVLACTAGISDYLPLRRGPLSGALMTHQLWGLSSALAALAWAMWRGYLRHTQGRDPASQTWGRLVSLTIAAATMVAASGGGALLYEHGLHQASPPPAARPSSSR